MDRSEMIKEIATALSKAQGCIGAAIKDKENPFHKSKYADLANVVDAIRVPLAENGLSFVQVSHDEPDSARIETIIMHSSGEWLSCGCVSVPVSKKDAQGFGSAITYARRYSLSAAFGVAPDDDDGNAAVISKMNAGAQDKYAARLVEQGMSAEEAKSMSEPAEPAEPVHPVERTNEIDFNIDRLVVEIAAINNIVHLKNKRAKLYGIVKTLSESGTDIPASELNRLKVAFQMAEDTIKSGGK